MMKKNEERKYMVFMMVNTSQNNKQNQRKITQVTILREERNSMN